MASLVHKTRSWVSLVLSDPGVRPLSTLILLRFLVAATGRRSRHRFAAARGPSAAAVLCLQPLRRARPRVHASLTCPQHPVILCNLASLRFEALEQPSPSRGRVGFSENRCHPTRHRARSALSRTFPHRYYCDMQVYMRKVITMTLYSCCISSFSIYLTHILRFFATLPLLVAPVT